MSLDQTELKIVQNTGTDAEKNYASVTCIQSLQIMQQTKKQTNKPTKPTWTDVEKNYASRG